MHPTPASWPPAPTERTTARRLGLVLVAAVVLPLVAAAGAWAQTSSNSAPAEQPTPPTVAADALGRQTPRRTVLGFLNAARRGQNDVARLYLDTRLSNEAAEELAHQLFLVLDIRLPARLAEISDSPEGSRANPLAPATERIGTIETGAGRLDIELTRIDSEATGPIWLFSRGTLELIPAAYEDVAVGLGNARLPLFMTRTRLGGIRLFEWVTVLLGLPLLYFLTVLLNRILTPLISRLWKRAFRGSERFGRNVLSVPVRLLLLAVAIRWLTVSLPLPILARQFWHTTASVLTTAGIAWLLIQLNGEVEQYALRRFPRASLGGGVSLLRLGRRFVDVFVIFVGFLVTLRHFSIDPTPALAGLGVGGIAVALAAQKTLENVIAGASLIFDQAVRLGDTLKLAEFTGTVEHIGLRSTRIRTLDRTIVSVPNGQIANATIETLSERDKYRFQPVLGLRYETTSEQLKAIVGGIEGMLLAHPSIERDSVRVRFIRLGAFSLDVDVFAYVLARDWKDFLGVQEQLLFGITDLVAKAGTEIAFPSQTMYVERANTSAQEFRGAGS